VVKNSFKNIKQKISIWWKFSALRFYIKNSIWNYKFWLFCEKDYKNISYFKKLFYRMNKQKILKNRFKGYRYQGKVYLDNPGVQIEDKEVWHEWKRKGLI